MECLFDDCNKVLIDIKKFVVSTNDNAPTEVVCASVTIPDTFELDAFDMGSLEDVSRLVAYLTCVISDIPVFSNQT